MSDFDQEKSEQRLFPREQEQSLIGALLRDNDAIDRIGDLQVDHFFDHWHGKIFAAISKLIVAGRGADVITTFEELQKAGSGAQVPSMAYLNDLQQSMPSSANIARYAATVRDRAIKRKLVALAHETAAAVPESPEDADALVDTMSSQLELLSRSIIKQEPQLARDGLAAHIDTIDMLYSGDGPVALSTGLPDLDKKLNGGLRPGQLIIIAGRPKMGKTALAANIANNIALAGGVSMVDSMEMTKSDLHNRNLASIGGIPLDHLIDPKQLDETDWPRLTHAITKIGEMELYLDDQPAMSLLDIRNKAKQVKRRAGRLSLIVIDYLQLMSGPGDNRNAQIESITRGLKALAKELGAPIILLSQLNRKLEERPNKRPMPSDLRDSGSIEQDADVVIFVYRDEVYNPDSPDKGIAEINVALHRQGAPGMVPMVYVGEYTLFKSAAHGWRPQETAMAPRRKNGFERLGSQS